MILSQVQGPWDQGSLVLELMELTQYLLACRTPSLLVTHGQTHQIFVYFITLQWQSWETGQSYDAVNLQLYITSK